MTDDAAADLVQRAIGDGFRLEPISPDFPTGQPPWRLFPATEVSTGRKVLVKAIPIEGGAPEIGLRFDREVGIVEYALSGLGQRPLPNPRVLPVLSRSRGDGIIYYVTPWLPEGSLRARLQREPMLPVADALAILDDMAATVGSLHQYGCVHSRLKPENDSPEFIRGERQGSLRNDVYSLAVMAFEMLAGRRPFLGTMMEAAYKKVTGTAPPITSLRPEISPALSDVLQKALSPNAADRFADANELRRELNAAAR